MTESPTSGHTPPIGEFLTCGRSADELFEQVSDGRAHDRDPHQRGCPHCQAALAEYDRLWSPMRELAAEKVIAPEGFVDDALARIRGAIENPDYGVLAADTGPGVTRIAARVVVVAARLSAQRVPGVRVALSQGLDPAAAIGALGDGSAVTAGVAGASTAIEITLAADYGTDLRALGDQVRRAVTSRVRELTDLQPVEVTVIIDDVLP